jgi:hypothetical protein
LSQRGVRNGIGLGWVPGRVIGLGLATTYQLPTGQWSGAPFIPSDDAFAANGGIRSTESLFRNFLAPLATSGAATWQDADQPVRSSGLQAGEQKLSDGWKRSSGLL